MDLRQLLKPENYSFYKPKPKEEKKPSYDSIPSYTQQIEQLQYRVNNLIENEAKPKWCPYCGDPLVESSWKVVDRYDAFSGEKVLVEYTYLHCQEIQKLEDMVAYFRDGHFRKLVKVRHLKVSATTGEETEIENPPLTVGSSVQYTGFSTQMTHD